MNFDALRDFFLENLDITVRNGDECRVRACLFCGHPRVFKVNVRTGSYICFRGPPKGDCGAHGRDIGLIMAILQCSYDDAIGAKSRLLRGERKTLLSNQEIRQRNEDLSTPKPRTVSVADMGPGLPDEYIPCFFDGEFQGTEYLEQRGVSLESIQRWEIGFATEGRLADRVIVPVRTAGVTTWVARATSKKMRQRYMTPKGGPTRVLFGYDQVPEDAELVVGVEGVFDAIRLWSYGIPTVGYLKDGFSFEQIALLERLRPRRVVQFPDGGDRKAQARALRDGVALASRFERFDVVIATGESKLDPDSAPRELAEHLIRDARPVTRSDLVRFKLGRLR